MQYESKNTKDKKLFGKKNLKFSGFIRNAQYWICPGIPKMFRNPENSVILNRKTEKSKNFFLKILKKKFFLKNFGNFFWNFQDLSVVRESRKFSNPEREYRIPENPIPGLFRNTESRKFSIPELQDSRSKKIREWPLRLFFLPNLPGPTLIPCPTDSRVLSWSKIEKKC
jgi:hypothetical protein